MSEEEQGTLQPVKPEPQIEDQSFLDLVQSFLGKTVTIVNPESFENAPVGYTLKANFYKAKVVGMGNDYVTLVTELKKGKEGAQPVKQFLPIARIKRISIMKLERLIHL
jgi:hypothetical protein